MVESCSPALPSPSKRHRRQLLPLVCAILFLPACGSADPWKKPASRKTARQQEHFERLYGPPPVLGQPSSSPYAPRAARPEGFATFH